MKTTYTRLILGLVGAALLASTNLGCAHAGYDTRRGYSQFIYGK
jgi:hypothetical protein